MRSTISLVSILVFFVASAEIGAQRRGGVVGVFSAEAEELFHQGLEAYQQGRFEQARDSFRRLLEFPLNPRSSAGQLMLSKSLFRLEEFGQALDTARNLEKRFTNSRYIPHARLLAGDCYYALRRYYEAVTQYGRLLATAAPLNIQAQAAEQLAAIVENGFISVDGLERVRMGVGANRLREALLFGKARWFRHLGWEEQGRIAMQAYVQNMPGGIFTVLVDGSGQDDLDSMSAVEPEPSAFSSFSTDSFQGEGMPRLGLLLPLSGSGFQRQVGEDLYAGVQLANEQLGEPFELVVADIGIDYGELQVEETESSRLLRVVQQTRRLIEQDRVLAIIGPVFSNDCVAAAVVAEAAGVPLIAPLAQQSGLDLVGEHIFQLHAIPEFQARALGEYATLVLGLQTLAIISPLTDYGWSFEQEFSRVAYANGGDVVHIDWYYPEVTKDFRRIFEDIRQVGFGLMPPPEEEDAQAVADSLARTIADSALAVDEPSFLSELLAGLEEEPIEEPAEEEAPPDSAEIFIDTIDGIVIVVESFEDAETIAPQLDFHRLTTQILGNDIWYEPESIRQLRPRDRSYIEGTTLVSGYQEETPTARSFVDSFRRRFARDIGYAASGYDAARLVISGWNEGQKEPASLRAWLAQTRDFDGAAGRISFVSGRRTNSELVLLKIDQRGGVRALGEEDLPELIPAIEEGFSPDDLGLEEPERE